MLNFPKGQLPALSHGKRRTTEPQAGGDASDIDSRPAKRPHLESPGQNQSGEPLITSMKPVVRVPDTAPHALWSIAPPVSSPIAPPVAQPSPPGPLPGWRQPSHDVAHALPIVRHSSAETVTLLAQVTSPTNALPGIASQPYRGLLATQAFKQAGSMGIIPSTTTTTTSSPASAVTCTAPQLRAVPDAPRSVGPVANGEDAEPVRDERFERIAQRVRDARQVKLRRAISIIWEAEFYSPPAVTVWLQLCALLCLHYDEQQKKKPLWQCLEKILLRIATIRKKPFRDLYDTAKTTLLATSMPAGFIRILMRAQASEWRESRLLKLFTEARIGITVAHAIKQMEAGRHPEKTAQQAAADFLLARDAAYTAHKAPYGDDLAAHIFGRVRGSTTTTTTTTATATTPAPAVTHPAQQMRAVADAPRSVGLVANGEDAEPVRDERFDLAAHVFGRIRGSMSTTTTTTATATTPAPAVTHPAQQVRAVPDAPRSAGPVAAGEDAEPVRDERFEWIAQRVRDARQVELQHAISTIREAEFYSPPAVTVWLQLCALLCLHYDEQQEKEPLWQCLEKILSRIITIRTKPSSDLYDTAKTTLLATSMPAGFIRILVRAQASEWRESQLLKLFFHAQIRTTVEEAITQVEAGRHPEKTARQAAADFLLARDAARAAHVTPAVAPNPPEDVSWFETVNPEFLFMPFFGEDIIDSDPLLESWRLPDDDYLATDAFEPASESMNSATTITATTPTPAVIYTVPQLRAAPDAPRHNGLVAAGDNERSVTESLLHG